MRPAIKNALEEFDLAAKIQGAARWAMSGQPRRDAATDHLACKDALIRRIEALEKKAYPKRRKHPPKSDISKY